jgi:dihydrolipoamide dehydrogenase
MLFVDDVSAQSGGRRIYVAEVIADRSAHINYNLIPGVVYTWPEVAAVGQTEEQLKASGVDYKVGFPSKH